MYVQDFSDRQQFLLTVIHLKIAPAYASLCITTMQKGNNFHREVSRGFLLFHAWPDLPDERILLTKAESADYQQTVPARRISTSSKKFESRPPGHGFSGFGVVL
jgi:hypothetical protein